MAEAPNIILRPFDAEDLPSMHRWLNSQESLGDFDQATFPAREKLQEKFQRGDYAQTWIIETNKGPVGYANFVLHPWDDWIACIGLVIADPQARGKGIGTRAHEELAEKIFNNFPRVEKLEAFTDTENVAEKRALEKSGFELEGTQRRKNKLRGEFRDMHVFALLRP